MVNAQSQNIRKLFFGAALLLIILFLVSPLTTGLNAQERTPNFTIDTLDGPFTLSDHLGKTVVLFFSFPG